MNDLTVKDWQAKSEELTVIGEAFLDGAYVPARSGKTFDNFSPVDGRLLARVARCDIEDANLAVASARSTFEAGTWSQLAPTERQAILVRLAGLIEANAEELALLETLDMGKPIGDALTVDIPSAALAIRWSAEAIDKIYGEVANTPKDQLGLITREPIGVVVAIVPWNFPLMMACWKLGPALAAGNSVVLKPSEKSPLSALRLAGLALEAGLPKGVLNVLPGFGLEVGRGLSRHNDVDTLVFTGSTRVGRQLLVDAGESNMKQVWLEGGGKSANVVFADAPNLEEAAEAAAAAIAFNQGEVCTAGSRLLVENSIREDFVTRVMAILERNWVPGDPLDPATKIGTLADASQLEAVLGYINSGKAEGATLRLGGAPLPEVCGGLQVPPTVFDDVRPEMRIAQEEIFGPVLSVIGFDSFEEAMTIANNTIYGLAAAVWTRDLSRAHRAARALQAGSVWVNQYDGGDMTAPFGGFKQSGNGRDKSLHAFDKYTQLKATWIKL